MPNKSWMDLEVVEEEDMYFINMVAAEQEEDNLNEDAIQLETEYEAWRTWQEAARLKRWPPQCVSNEEEYILWKERQRRFAGGSQEEIVVEEELAWLGRMREGECLREDLREYLGKLSRADR
jgi:hypothetical protein